VNALIVLTLLVLFLTVVGIAADMPRTKDEWADRLDAWYERALDDWAWYAEAHQAGEFAYSAWKPADPLLTRVFTYGEMPFHDGLIGWVRFRIGAKYASLRYEAYWIVDRYARRMGVPL